MIDPAAIGVVAKTPRPVPHSFTAKFIPEMLTFIPLSSPDQKLSPILASIKNVLIEGIVRCVRG